MTLQSINREKRFYVLASSAGVSCLGFDVCEARRLALWEWVGLEGRRVEVTGPGGYRKRFTVGISRGWIPCHIEIARRDSTGGPGAYIPKGGAVRVVS